MEVYLIKITDVIGVCDNVTRQQYLKLAAEKPN